MTPIIEISLGLSVLALGYDVIFGPRGSKLMTAVPLASLAGASSDLKSHLDASGLRSSDEFRSLDHDAMLRAMPYGQIIWRALLEGRSALTNSGTASSTGPEASVGGDGTQKKVFLFEHLLMLFTILCACVALPLHVDAFVRWNLVAGSWDARVVGNDLTFLSLILAALRTALGVDDADLVFAAALAGGVCAVLWLADTVGLRWPASWGVQLQRTVSIASTDEGQDAVISGSKSQAVRRRSQTPAREASTPDAGVGGATAATTLTTLSDKDLRLLHAPDLRSPCMSATTSTYEDTFSEPPALRFFACDPKVSELCIRPRLISRPGNTFSNALYFFNGALLFRSLLPRLVPHVHALSSLASTESWRDHGTLEKLDSHDAGFPFLLSDATFATMQLYLGVLSVVWHASHYNVAHYYDIWIMNACILYLKVRVACLAGAVLTVGLAAAPGSLHGIPAFSRRAFFHLHAWGLASLVLFLLSVLLGYRTHISQDRYADKTLHTACRWAGRTRLWLGELDIIGACLYLALPVIYYLLPALLQVFVFRDLGSVTLARVGCGSLALAWTYRYSERFVLDGNFVMRWAWRETRRAWKSEAEAAIRIAMSANSVANGSSRSAHSAKPSTNARVRAVLHRGFVRMLAAAFSPTSVLHVATGVTLLAVHGQLMSLDQVVVKKMVG